MLPIQIFSRELTTLLDTTKSSFSYDFSNVQQAFTFVGLEYRYSMYVRGDNDPAYAKYLGYLDARELYPEFVPRTFEAYAKDLLEGKAVAVYQGWSFQAW